MGSPYYAVVYAYDADGTEKASMPCFTHQEMMARAARYERVRVVMDGRPPFWLTLTPQARHKYPKPQLEDIPLEWLRDYADVWAEGGEEKVASPAGPSSQMFYDIWKGIKRDRRW